MFGNMERNETGLSSIANRKVVEEICKNMRVDSEYFDDLVQEVYYILLTGYTDEVLEKATEQKQEKFIITSIVKRQWLSKTSPFYRQYKKPNLKKVPMNTNYFSNCTPSPMMCAISQRSLKDGR